jgi:ABC-type polysaccharide/polyol phosphate transport system ATPase subunit
MAQIVLADVDLTFHLRARGSASLKEWALGRLLGRPRRAAGREIKALQKISLSVQEGERLGVIGHNGAGKSTLLKVLAGVYRPSAGRRLVEGRVCSLFDLTLGFDVEATGWENIVYRSYLQREHPRVVRAKKGPIGEASELGEALDMPVRYYSSGMLVRLAFAIATAVEPEVLLIDEVLAAGDLSFQEKARRRMRDLIQRARLLVLVSHDLEAVPTICDRLLWLDHGRVRALGPVGPILAAYREAMQAPVAQVA